MPRSYLPSLLGREDDLLSDEIAQVARNDPEDPSIS